MENIDRDFCKSVLDSLTGGIIVFDLEGRVLYLNHTAEVILHLEKKNCEGKLYKEVLSRFGELLDLVKDMIEYQKTARRSHLNILHADTPLKIGYSTMKVRKKEKELGYTLIFQDISMVPGR